MGKLKLMTIIGTRPEIIRLSATIKCCDRYFEQILVHTGQNYDYTVGWSLPLLCPTVTFSCALAVAMPIARANIMITFFILLWIFSGK